jgi:hypothetical protein
MDSKISSWLHQPPQMMRFVNCIGGKWHFPPEVSEVSSRSQCIIPAEGRVQVSRQRGLLFKHLLEINKHPREETAGAGETAVGLPGAWTVTLTGTRLRPPRFLCSICWWKGSWVGGVSEPNPQQKVQSSPQPQVLRHREGAWCLHTISTLSHLALSPGARRFNHWPLSRATWSCL